MLHVVRHHIYLLRLLAEKLGQVHLALGRYITPMRLNFEAVAYGIGFCFGADANAFRLLQVTYDGSRAAVGGYVQHFKLGFLRRLRIGCGIILFLDSFGSPVLF